MSLLCTSERPGRLEFKQPRKRSLRRAYHVYPRTGVACEARSSRRSRPLFVLQRTFEKSADGFGTGGQVSLLSAPIVHPGEQARFS